MPRPLTERHARKQPKTEPARVRKRDRAPRPMPRPLRRPLREQNMLAEQVGFDSR